MIIANLPMEKKQKVSEIKYVGIKYLHLVDFKRVIWLLYKCVSEYVLIQLQF